MMNKNRCPWAVNPLDIEYHDNEWGRETHNDQMLFEYLRNEKISNVLLIILIIISVPIIPMNT